MEKLRHVLTCLRLGSDDVILSLHRAIFGPPTAPALNICLDVCDRGSTPSSLSVAAWDGLLLAVPKHRRSVEKRMMRRYGAEQWLHGRKLLRQQRLFFCFNCGNTKLAGTLCLTCFNKVMDETRRLQREINQQLGFEPRRSELLLVYNDDQDSHGPSDQTDRDRRVVEVPRSRPQWFSSNLMQKVVGPFSTGDATDDVRPSDLG